MTSNSIKIRQELFELSHDLKDSLVKRVAVGVHMTAVESHTVGCAFTFRDPQAIPHLCVEIPGAGNMAGSSVKKLAQNLAKGDFLGRSVGMAALNSMLNFPSDRLQKGDILQWMAKKFAGANVGMVGHFPFAPEIKKWAGEFHIVEKEPVEDDLNEEEGAKWLQKCDAVIITGVTILNDTLLDVIKKCPNAFKLMLGPTVPMHDYLLYQGIDALAGIICTDSEKYYNSIAEGAIVPRFKGSMPMVYAKDKLNLPNGDFRKRIVDEII
jgi:uncharacterized protein (DUF4213/DUF364 family)